MATLTFINDFASPNTEPEHGSLTPWCICPSDAHEKNKRMKIILEVILDSLTKGNGRIVRTDTRQYPTQKSMQWEEGK
jgi:hypothetical protein